MGDDFGSGPVTDCRQQCRAAPRQKSKQMQPEPMPSPINYPVYQGVWFINEIETQLFIWHTPCLIQPNPVLYY